MNILLLILGVQGSGHGTCLQSSHWIIVSVLKASPPATSPVTPKLHRSNKSNWEHLGFRDMIGLPKVLWHVIGVTCLVFQIFPATSEVATMLRRSVQSSSWAIVLSISIPLNNRGHTLPKTIPCKTPLPGVESMAQMMCSLAGGDVCL